MKKGILSLWRAELRKEATLWWEELDKAQQDNWACERTSDEVIDNLVAAKMETIETIPSIAKHYHNK